LRLTIAGLVERDRQVYPACRRAGLPVAAAMAEGDAPAIEDSVEIHARTISIAPKAAVSH
jgi:hypothetical protein